MAAELHLAPVLMQDCSEIDINPRTTDKHPNKIGITNDTSMVATKVNNDIKPTSSQYL